MKFYPNVLRPKHTISDITIEQRRNIYLLKKVESDRKPMNK